MSKYIGVIGGSGFVGSEIVKQLKSDGYKVRVIDIKKSDEGLADYKQADVTLLEEIVTATGGLDGIIHLGAVVGVDVCNSDSQLVKNVNLEGVKNVVEACKINNIRRLLFSSSSEVYGDGDKTPFNEDGVKFPKSVYGKTKLLAEEFLKTQASDMLKISIVRYFNVYGENQRNEFVVKKFIEKALNNESITIYGDGGQVRCYTHIDDAVYGTLLVYYNQKDVYNIFNVANLQPLTVTDLARMIILKTDSKSNIKYIKLDSPESRSQDIEIFKRIPCIDKITKTFGYTAKMSIEEGLSSIIKNIKARSAL